MGVKSLTVFLDDNGRDICVLSRSIDGYLSGHGENLKRFLRGHVIARELRAKDNRKVAASMGHLAVLLIKDFRSGLGLFELLPCETRDQGEEYVYTVYPRHTSTKAPSLLNLRIEATFPSFTGPGPSHGSSRTLIYEGLLDEFDPKEVEAQWECSEEEMDKLVDGEVALAGSMSGKSATADLLRNGRPK